MEEPLTYAVGHLALGCWSRKATSKLLNANVNIPSLFLASTLPDIDLLIPGLALLLSTFLSFPLSVPAELIIPHLTYLTLFTLSTVIDFKTHLDEKPKKAINRTCFFPVVDPTVDGAIILCDVQATFETK